MALTQVKSDGIATGAVTATQIATDAITVDDIADGSISTAKLAADCVDGTKIADDAVNTEHIADDSVGADQLANTAVTAGSYTLASVTVDAQGRITAASSGTAGDTDKIEEGNTSAEVVDTGSDGHFKVVTEGTEALRVDSSQQVGIGTASPQRALHISTGSNADLGNISIALGGTFSGLRDATITKNTSSPYGLTFTSSNSGTTHAPLIFETRAGLEKARLDTSGRFLVGTDTARANFSNSTYTADIQLEAIDNPRLAIISSSSATSRGGALILAHQRSGSIGGNTLLNGTHSIGLIDFQGNDGSEFVSAAQIEGVVDSTYSSGANDMPGRLIFRTTADNGVTPAERMKIHAEGSVEIGSTSNVSSTCNSTGFRFNYGSGFWWSTTGANSYWNTNVTTQLSFRRNGSTVGYINWGATNTSFGTSSDYRMKENVVALDGAIDRVKQLLPKRFNFIAEPERTVDGFIAHEAQTVVPEAVTGIKDELDVWTADDKLPDGVSVGDNKLDEDGNPLPKYQGIDQSKLVPLLTAALQEAIAKIETLETRITALETP